MQLTISQILKITGGKLIQGDESTIITGVSSIETAKNGDLIFVRDKKYENKLSSTNASAVLLKEEPSINLPKQLVCICVPFPEIAFIQVVRELELDKYSIPFLMGIHPSAIISENVSMQDRVAIGPNVFVGKNTVLGRNVVIFPNVFIGENCEIGNETVIFSNVTIREFCKIGSHCILHAGVCIGSDGFGFVQVGNDWVKVPQIGTVIIEDHVEIGSNTCIDRGTLGETRIGSGTKIDNLVQIGHNVKIGKNCAIAAMTGIAGSAIIGDNVRIGAGSGINGHITIGDGATIGAWSGVVKSVEPGTTVSGFPAVEHSKAKRILVAKQHMPDVLRRLKIVEERLSKLENMVYE